jgi:Na+-driven multidrug efflux pump
MSTTMSADALAVAAQALLARSVAAGDLRGARAVAERCIVLGMGLGAALALGVGIFRHPIARVFTSDEVVLALIASEWRHLTYVKEDAVSPVTCGSRSSWS